MSAPLRLGQALAFAFVATVALARPGSAAAQGDACLTKPDKIAATLNAKDAYTLAKAEASKVSADSALIDMMSTPPGALDAEGRTSSWMLQFFSVAAKKLQVVSLNSGEMTCSTVASEFKPVTIGETAETIFDSARLLKIATETAGAGLDPTLKVSANLRRTDPSETAYWVISYVSPQGRPMVSIIIDSKTGAGRRTPG